MAISTALGIAQSALLANERALDVVGNNIANVNTPGYTRQTPSLEEGPSEPLSGVLIGTGVRMTTIRQVLDPLLTKRVLIATADDGQNQAVRDQLTALANVMNDLQDPSLSSALSGFFDAADALSRNPSGSVERQTFLSSATALANQLNRRSQQVAAIQRDTDDRVVSAATQVNGDLQKVADLNAAIVNAEVSGQRANDLRDQRHVVLTELANLAGFSSIEDDRGAASVTAPNGLTLVAGSDVVFPVTTQPGSTLGLDGAPVHDVGVSGPGGTFLSVPGTFAAGTIAGLLSVRDASLVSASSGLDTLALALRDQANAVQQDPTALDLDGMSTVGVPLFGGSGASDLSVLITDTHKIAAALSSQPGDNQNALRFADLRSASIPALGNVSLGNYLSDQLAQIGDAASRATDAAAASGLLVGSLQNEQQAISGVNLNEELTSLIKFQRAFQASAQLLNVTNSTLDELLRTI
jgi:flagellar hook-associated protein 1 FlgK